MNSVLSCIGVTCMSMKSAFAALECRNSSAFPAVGEALDVNGYPVPANPVFRLQLYASEEKIY